MSKAIIDELKEDIQPNWHKQTGVPDCSEDCASHDGKRCSVMGFRPDGICEPAVQHLMRRIDLEAAS